MKRYKWLNMLIVLVIWVILTTWHLPLASAQEPDNNGRVFLRSSPVGFPLLPLPPPTPPPPPPPPWPWLCAPQVAMVDFSDNLLTLEAQPRFANDNSEFRWEFGDGTTATGLSVTHQFAGLEGYQVNLIVVNTDESNLCSTQISFPILPDYEELLTKLKEMESPLILVPAINSNNTFGPFESESTGVSLIDQYIQPNDGQISFSSSLTNTAFIDETSFPVVINRYEELPSSGEHASNLPESGQEYVVQADDWLSKLAEKEYTYNTDWPAIWLATNARASIDDNVTFITNPDQIEIGQKIWIPSDIDFEYLPPLQ